MILRFYINIFSGSSWFLVEAQTPQLYMKGTHNLDPGSFYLWFHYFSLWLTFSSKWKINWLINVPQTSQDSLPLRFTHIILSTQKDELPYFSASWNLGHFLGQLIYPSSYNSFLVLHPETIGIPVTCCCCSVVQSCLTLCDPMDCSTPGFPVLHHLLKLAQTHAH